MSPTSITTIYGLGADLTATRSKQRRGRRTSDTVMSMAIRNISVRVLGYAFHQLGWLYHLPPLGVALGSSTHPRAVEKGY